MNKKAIIYRMVMDKHVCPYGLSSISLLKSKGYKIEDHQLKTRDETEAFKAKYDVKTTPQIFIDDKRIGGYDDLKAYFGKTRPEFLQKYQPIITVFASTLLMALAGSWAIFSQFDPYTILKLFVGFSMCVLSILKLRDLESFSLQFLNYDLLAQKFVPYAKIYAFAEMIVGALMIAGTSLTFIIAAPIAFFIGSVGAVSVFKAVYIDKRDLKCACVGGNSKVPLGFISLSENLMMVGMGIIMFAKFIY
jgi:glutaredoxin